MISVAEALVIHDLLIELFSGSKGIRDKSSLQSALSRPFQTFEQKDLYPNPEDKAAAILESIVVTIGCLKQFINHDNQQLRSYGV